MDRDRQWCPLRVQVHRWPSSLRRLFIWTVFESHWDQEVIYSAGQKFRTFNAMNFLWPPWERGYGSWCGTGSCCCSARKNWWDSSLFKLSVLGSNWLFHLGRLGGDRLQKKFDRESSSEVRKMLGCPKCKYENCIFICRRLTVWCWLSLSSNDIKSNHISEINELITPSYLFFSVLVICNVYPVHIVDIVKMVRFERLMISGGMWNTLDQFLL